MPIKIRNKDSQNIRDSQKAGSSKIRSTGADPGVNRPSLGPASSTEPVAMTSGRIRPMEKQGFVQPNFAFN